MSTTIEKKRGQVVEVVHEPGNGTRYEVIAARRGALSWMVCVPYWHGCLPGVPVGSFIHYDYVMEKMPRVKSKIDASEIAKAIAMAVPKCQAVGCTNERGNLEE